MASAQPFTFFCLSRPQHQFFNTKSNHQTRKGFTFVEVMVTLAILSTGFIVIFKTLFYSLDQINALSSRIQADLLIENRIGEIERFLRVYNALPMELKQNQVHESGIKKFEFKEQMSFQDVDELSDVFRLNFSVSWQERNRLIKITRTAYLLDLNRSKRK